MTHPSPAASDVHAPPHGDDPLGRLLRYRSHPYDFIRDCVLTLDQADRRNPIKRFPFELPYVKPVLDQWLQERLIIVRKSRRMLFSWLAVAYCVWDAMFHIGRNIFFVSDKEEKSDILVQRAHFIVEHIPEGVLSARPEYKYTYCSLKFPTLNTEIKGIPQGANQLRQETASVILADEFAFWEQAKATYAGMRPTIEGGGQIIIISTSQPGFMRELVNDTAE